MPQPNTLPEKFETRNLTGFEVRKDDKGKAVGLRGYASVFNSESEDFGGWREVVKPGAFKADLDAKKDIRALINHDSGRVIARSKAGTLKLSEDETGLAVDIDLPDTQDARDLMANIEAGNIDAMSFGFITRKAVWEERETYDIRNLEDVELIEVSVVAFPAYPATTIGKRSYDDFQSTRQKPDARKTDVMRRRLQCKHKTTTAV